MHYYLKVLQNYINFSGRAQRAEYWYFYLFNTLIAVGVILIDISIGTYNADAGTGLLHSMYVLCILLPSIAVAVRRLHDIGKSGWMLLILLIPLIGFIWLIILLVKDSEPGDNQYGPNPKGVPAPAAEPLTDPGLGNKSLY